MNKNMPVCLLFYSASFLLVSSSLSWFSLWLAMELNTMMFLALLFLSNKKNMESVTNYFLIQAMSSIFLLFSMVGNEITSTSKVTPSLLLILTLLVKLGAAPFHNWFIPMCYLVTSKITFWLTITMQKLIPLLMISINSNKMNYLLLLSAFLCSLMGSSMNMKQNSMKMMIILSSISNLGWILLSTFKQSTLEIYITFYFTITLMIMYLINLDLKKNMTSKKLKLILLNMMMLGAVPPMLGFWPKLMVSMMLLEMMLLMLLLLILVMSVLDLFVYAQLSLISIMGAKSTILWSKEGVDHMWKFMMLNTLALFLWF